MSNRRLNAPAMAFLGVAALVVCANACIFEEGKYKKGGRLDTAASVQESSSSGSSSSGAVLDDDDDIGTTSSSSSSSGLPADAGIQ